MNRLILMALAASLGTWAVTALGAATVVFFRSPSAGVMNVMLGFSAGVMIAASFWSLLQPAIERAEAAGGCGWAVATGGFLTGAAFIWASDKAVSLSRRRAELSSGLPAEKLNRIIMLVLSITLHNIPEGLAVGVAFGALGSGAPKESVMGAVTIAIGIGLQNFPEGAAVSLPLRREGVSRRKSFFMGQASGMVEPVAAVLGAAMAVFFEHVLPFALSFAAGAMILVSVHELIPESRRQQKGDPYLSSLGVVAGFAVMMMLDVMLG